MEKLFTCDYSKPSGTVHLDKYDIPLPAKPPLKEFRNYGLPQHQQKFRHEVIPKTLLKRKSILSKEEMDFIFSQWHKRFNGEWWLINGREIYITGPYHYFLNYHTRENGKHPEYRYTQGLIFNFKDMLVRDSSLYGAFIIGPRRAGKTEITLGMVEDYITSVKSIHAGMQSKNDTAAYENFKRVTYSVKNLVWFMKPITKGSDDPEDKLEFKYPSRTVTDKRIRDLAESGEEEESPYTEEEMGSWLDYGPSNPGHYDRTELNFWILNEAGKLERMSLLACWDKVKSCLHYNNGKTIIGTAIFETTIEELNDDQIEEINVLVKDSNYNERDENGRTTSGLCVLFISHADCYDEDEFGFPMREEAEKFLANTIANLQKRKKFNMISDLLRKNPRTIEDALTPSGNQSSFNKERLQDILQRLDYPEKFGFEQKEWGIRGNFIWANGQYDTKVIFIPDEKGKFFVSQLLKDGEDNQQMMHGGVRYPLNVHNFRGGVDPFDFDLKEVIDKSRASKGGAVMMRLYDDNEDGAKTVDGAPVDFAWEWRSKQPVATYLAREEDSKVFFEDMLMMHVYYGTQMNVENNKKVIKNHFKDRGYNEYIMPRPESTMNENQRVANAGVLGTPASTDTIDQYFHAIMHYVMVYSNAIKHRDLILQLLEGNKNNRSKLDLMVAFGMALIACEKKYPRLPQYEEVSDGADWFVYQEI